jgi:cyanophycinase
MRKIAALSLVLFVAAFAAAEPGDGLSEIRGTLVIAGGGELPEEIPQRFLQLAGGRAARVVIIPSTSPAARDAEASGVFDFWKKQNLETLVLLSAQDRAEADDAAFIKPLTTATGVWLEGGDTARFAAVYRDTATQRELQRLLARGGTVGATAAGTAVLGKLAIVGEHDRVAGLDLLPGFVIDSFCLRRNRLNRLHAALAMQPGLVGIGVDERAAIVVKGRTLEALGSSYTVLCQAAGPSRPATTQVLRAGDKGDLFALRRAAVARTQPPFPAAQPAPPDVPAGALMIGGGGGLSEAIYKRFIELAGGPDAPLVVIPTAQDDPVQADPGEAKALRRAGAKNVKVVHTRDRAVAGTPEFLAPLHAARGLWFTGGRQWRLVDAYAGTAAEQAFHAILRRGGAIGGSSAGASIQSEYMPRGDPLGNLNIMAAGYERGFGFLKGTAVDQHFMARRRQAQMTELMKVYPQLLGIGIDEGTVIIVRGHTLEVMGKSLVAVYDRRRPVGAGKDYEELPPGSHYDLQKRRRDP